MYFDSSFVTDAMAAWHNMADLDPKKLGAVPDN